MTKPWTAIDEDNPDTYPPTGVWMEVVHEDAEGYETEDIAFWNGSDWRICIQQSGTYTYTSEVIRWRERTYPSDIE